MPVGPVHSRPHPSKGKRVTIHPHVENLNLADGDTVTVVDWHDRETGHRVSDVFGDRKDSPATQYMVRRRKNTMAFPKDDEIVVVITRYGLRTAIHGTEIEKEPDSG